MKFRKKYTPEEALKAIKILKIQMQNNFEEIAYWNTRDDALILILV